MREHKFRGKRLDNGDWIYGDLINGCAMYIREPPYMSKGSNNEMSIVALPVDPETVGEYTGLHDKNGKEIYEGDIVATKDYTERIGVIKFGKYKQSDMSNSYECGNLGFYIDFKDDQLLRQDIYFWYGRGFEVIGNKHETSYLLNRKE